MAFGRHLEKWIWRHNCAESGSILTKFCRSMRNNTLITNIWWKFKPEMKFQYGGRPYSENGSSFISAVDWDISSKFDVQIDFHLKWVQSQDLNSEVDFTLYGRRLEKSIWRHNFAAVRPITTKFGRQMQNDRPITTHGSIWKPEVEFQNADHPFLKPEVRSYILAVDWDKIFYRNLVWK